MKLSRYLPLATSPIAALSIFNLYRQTFGIDLHGWLAQMSFEIECIVHGVLNFGPERLMGFHPPAILSDLWVISLWWTGVMAFGTVRAMQDKGAPTPWLSHVAMVPLRLFLGYSLIGFFIAATVVPISFARFKTEDDDLDRYSHWIRVYTIACILTVAVLFLLNHAAR